MKIHVILGSTRENRKGEIVAKWVFNELQHIKDFSSELIDLREYPLPFYDESKTPKSMDENEYKNEVARKWVKRVGEADGYIIVTPEYNHGYPAVLKNALDYPYKQWNNKPIAFVSYGASANGTRSVEQLRLVAIELQMTPIREAVALPVMDFKHLFNDHGEMQNNFHSNILQNLFTQLAWWTKALKTARVNS
jgi:NAD(P)H-dependent FMN reductase